MQKQKHMEDQIEYSTNFEMDDQTCEQIGDEAKVSTIPIGDNQEEQVFLDQVDAELDEIDKENQTGNLIIPDEICDNIDMIYNPTENQADFLSKKAKQQITRIKNKMEKIQVAPGEFGKFKNWGDDIFLEEKIFPEKFPFGTGGYLSSCIDNPENDMGFANYCINQIMS